VCGYEAEAQRQEPGERAKRRMIFARQKKIIPVE
jgi:hypothetical protein